MILLYRVVLSEVVMYNFHIRKTTQVVDWIYLEAKLCHYMILN